MTPGAMGNVKPYGLIRLIDLINVSAIGFGSFCSQLMNELLQVSVHLHDTQDYLEPVPFDKMKILQTWLKLWREEAESFEWDHVVSAIDRMNKSLLNGATFKDVEYGLRSIQDGLRDGLKNQLVYRYPNDKAKVLESWKDDWAPVVTRFPHCHDDILSGVDLWALGHSTASVFHMMRVLESGLGSLATDLNISFAIENWQTVIDRIEAAIKEQQKRLPRGGDKSTRLQFLGEAAKEFSYFKDGWRNYVSHNRAPYDSHRARSVLEHVRQFMSSLARNLPALPEVSDQGLSQKPENLLSHQAPERPQ